jgi:hypothetical protein
MHVRTIMVMTRDLLYRQQQFISNNFDTHRGAAHDKQTTQRGTSKRNIYLPVGPLPVAYPY